MKDTDLGTRDKRGFWKPKELINYGPLFSFPTHLLKNTILAFFISRFYFSVGCIFYCALCNFMALLNSIV